MLEDFGWSGDEFLMGDCMDDWKMDLLDLGADRYEEERRVREELALEFADEKGERDLCDLVREHEESECDPEDDYDPRDDYEPDDGFYFHMDDGGE